MFQDSLLQNHRNGRFSDFCLPTRCFYFACQGSVTFATEECENLERTVPSRQATARGQLPRFGGKTWFLYHVYYSNQPAFRTGIISRPNRNSILICAVNTIRVVRAARKQSPHHVAQSPPSRHVLPSTVALHAGSFRGGDWGFHFTRRDGQQGRTDRECAHTA